MTTIDVRSVPPRDRHPRIFAAFDALAAGDGFELVNDHDPKPLYHQLRAERGAALDWSYLEQGPDVWRVRIGRQAGDVVAPVFAFHADLAALVGDVPEATIVSRLLHHDAHVKVTLFGFAPGQELTEHTSSKPAIMQVIAGEGTFGFGGDVQAVAPGSWAHMAPSVPHTVTARTRLVFLLTMLKQGG
jgi:uncharacterized protein (DUF2249 family)/quercetin dioxygenase-like cupin family protein